jgi:hypothetical protein
VLSEKLESMSKQAARWEQWFLHTSAAASISLSEPA